MTTIKCGRDISINTSSVSPGTDEEWIAGNPLIDWGDDTTTTDETGGTASHTYSDVGEYTITLVGQNTCGRNCTHTEDVLVIENPTGIDSDAQKTSATVSWNSVPGCSAYKILLYAADVKLLDGDVLSTSYSFENLDPETTYTCYVSAMVGTICSNDYCGNVYTMFETLAEEGDGAPTIDPLWLMAAAAVVGALIITEG